MLGEDPVHEPPAAGTFSKYRAGYYAIFVEEPADAGAFFDPVTRARLRVVEFNHDLAELSRPFAT